MKDEKWYNKAWAWAYKHGLTPLNKRFWAITIISYGLAKEDAGLTGVGLAAFGAGEYDAKKSKDRESNVNEALDRAKSLWRAKKWTK